MLRFSLRLREQEKNWMKFFRPDRVPTYDYSRIFKEMTDPNKFLPAFNESLVNEFNDMSFSQMMKTASVYDIIYFHSKRRFKGKNQASDFVDKLQIRVTEMKDSDWTGNNLANWCEFVKKNKLTYSIKFTTDISEEILSYNTQNIHSYGFLHLCTIASCIYGYPEIYEKYYSALINKFASFTGNFYVDFDILSEEELKDLITGGVTKRNSYGRIIQINELEFPKTQFSILKSILLKRIDQGFFDENLYVKIAGCFTALTGPSSLEILSTLTEKVITLLDIEKRSIDMDFGAINPLILSRLANGFGISFPRSKELFELLSTKLYVSHLLKQSMAFSSMLLESKLLLISYYLRVAALHNIFQLAFLDISVGLMSELLESKGKDVPLWLVCSTLSALGSLNYQSRFNTSMPHKELQWQLWHNLLRKSEEIVLKKYALTEIDEFYDSDNEAMTNQNSHLILEYFWALCVFDSYSRPGLSVLLPSLSFTKEELTPSQYRKLYQIHIWLEKEYSSEFRLNNELVSILDTYKNEHDKGREGLSLTSELKEAIYRTLIDGEYDFYKDYKEFPYVLDFVNLGKEKTAVIVDDENSFLEGTSGIIRPGGSKVMHRQLMHMGWNMKKYSLRTWLKSGHIKIFPSK